ncbi:Protein kinase dsk1 [Porphyridium purpureum]|uniref:non-specific serine/threonine protein kinase n=1 Tax=Porphyridium purpureum TaxID=35688 RepID=A0A5J4YR71_PORPP|nr:Protein kinase dsk1 [Porphyridium purpureum]|eukprot:POR2214..scf229_5
MTGGAGEHHSAMESNLEIEDDSNTVFPRWRESSQSPVPRHRSRGGSVAPQGAARPATGEENSSVFGDSEPEEYEPDADTDVELDESVSENPEDYGIGGYYRVRPGEMFMDGRYCAIRKLGWGHFSTVWLCYDSVRDHQVAIKFQKSAFHYTESARDEINLLTELARHDPEGKAPVMRLLDQFEVESGYGVHVALVLELLGKSLLTLIRRSCFRGVDLKTVKRIAYHILKGLQFCHEKARIIHTDLKPENILFVYDAEEFEHERLRLKEIVQAVKRQDELLRGSRRGRRGGKRSRVRDEVSEDAMDDIFGTGAQGKRGVESGSRTAVEMAGAYRNVAVNDNSDREDADDYDSEQELRANDADAKLVQRLVQGLEVAVDPARSFASGVVKIADFGNACWIDEHYTKCIQTRQYRCPEVILGADYSETADIWSVACLVFELATGDFLFDPHTGRDYDRDEDHLALIMELLGPMRQVEFRNPTMFNVFMSRNEELRRIKRLTFWPLREVVREKYRFTREEADALSDFCLPMLAYEIDKRASASQCLDQGWLDEVKIEFEGLGASASAVQASTHRSGIFAVGVPRRSRTMDLFSPTPRSSSSGAPLGAPLSLPEAGIALCSELPDQGFSEFPENGETNGIYEPKDGAALNSGTIPVVAGGDSQTTKIVQKEEEEKSVRKE